MISVLMSRLLWMSVVGSAAIVLVMLIRLLLLRAPKIFSYLLWSLALFRLLCPFAGESGLSFIGLWQRALEALPSYVIVEEAADGRNGQAIARSDAFSAIGQFMWDGAQAGFLEPESFSNIPNEAKDGRDALFVERAGFLSEQAAAFLFFAWLAGVCAMLAVSYARVRKLRRFLEGARLEDKNIYVKSGIGTSFVTGCLRPKIYLPEGMSERERQYVLVHEQTHIRRGDVIFCRLFFLALMLHWFNPLVWAAFSLCMRDMEMSCDEAVVRRLGDQVRRDYSNSLLAMAVGERSKAVPPMAFGGGDTKSRIRNVLRCKRIKPAAAVCCALLLAAAVPVLATNPGADGGTKAGTAGTEGHQSVRSAGTAGTEGHQPVRPAGAGEENHGDVRTRPDHENAGVTEYGDGGSQPESVNGGSSEPVGENTPENDGKQNPSAEDAGFTAVVSVKSIARSARAIDSLEPPEEPKYARLLSDGAAFAEDCRFFLNYNFEAYSPVEVSFSEFADEMQDEEHLPKPCRITYYGGMIHEITLLATRGIYGLSYAPLTLKAGEAGLLELSSYGGEGALKQKYMLLHTTELDVSDAAGTETIEVYAGDCGYGDDGVMLVKDERGNVLYSAYAYNARPGFQSIYAGRQAGGGPGYLLVLTMEDRGDAGRYEYQMFRPNADGSGLDSLAGSSFTWGTGTKYDADEFAKWCHMLGHYLDDSRLVLELQNGTLRAKPDCDSERYCYRTLVPQCYDDPYEGMDISRSTLTIPVPAASYLTIALCPSL